MSAMRAAHHAAHATGREKPRQRAAGFSARAFHFAARTAIATAAIMYSLVRAMPRWSF